MFTEALSGAIAGFLATGPMTAFMEGAFRGLPRAQRQPLPPRQITARLLSRFLPHSHRLAEGERQTGTVIAHFAFGAAMGTVFSAIACRAIRPNMTTGIGCGVLVWLLNYAGILPLLKLQPPPQHRSVRRNLLMAAAHIVWGATFGWLLARLPHRGRNS
jgi:uncharacterized membrane protein YagU involved in acid resistance